MYSDIIVCSLFWENVSNSEGLRTTKLNVLLQTVCSLLALYDVFNMAICEHRSPTLLLPSLSIYVRTANQPIRHLA